MNPFCPDCGWRLQPNQVMAAWECESCGKIVSELDRMFQRDPVVRHGVQCSTCGGEGCVEIPFVEYHPYGDTYAAEHLVEVVDCADCAGRGYFLDDESCVVCGEPVKDGCLVQGWEVHEDCAFETVPTVKD